MAKVNEGSALFSVPFFFSSKDQVHKDDTLGLLTNEGLVYVEGHGEWYHVSGCV